MTYVSIMEMDSVLQVIITEVNNGNSSLSGHFRDGREGKYQNLAISNVASPEENAFQQFFSPSSRLNDSLLSTVFVFATATTICHLFCHEYETVKVPTMSSLCRF